MGLDNGLIIKAKNHKGAEFLRKIDCFEEEEVNSERYELGYWRKCYNIRAKVLDEFKRQLGIGIGETTAAEGLRFHF